MPNAATLLSAKPDIHCSGSPGADEFEKASHNKPSRSVHEMTFHLKSFFVRGLKHSTVCKVTKLVRAKLCLPALRLGPSELWTSRLAHWSVARTRKTFRSEPTILSLLYPTDPPKTNHRLLKIGIHCTLQSAGTARTIFPSKAPLVSRRVALCPAVHWHKCPSQQASGNSSMCLPFFHPTLQLHRPKANLEW